MMWFDVSFFKNPFDDAHYSRARKLTFAYDQIARLSALDATGFKARIIATRAAADALSTAGGTTGAATGAQRGATLGTNTQLQAFRKVVGSKYNVLLDRFGSDKEAPLLITVFGASIQAYTRDLTKTNAQTRLETLTQLLAANAAALGPDIVQPITEAASTYLGTRQLQTTDKGHTSVAQLTEGTQEAALNQALWLNLGDAVARYPAPEQAPQRHAAANFSLLLRRAVGPTPHTETGPVPPTAIVNLVDEGLLPTTRLRLHNAGAVPLHFALSKTANALTPGQPPRQLLPTETLDLLAADLGDVAFFPCLNVHNPAETGPAGQYEVTVG